MSALEEALASLLTALADHHARCAIVGGLAVSVRTEPRFTRDADVCIAVASDREAEELVIATGRIATARMTTARERDGDVLLDLLFASSGVEHALDALRAERDI